MTRTDGLRISVGCMGAVLALVAGRLAYLLGVKVVALGVTSLAMLGMGLCMVWLACSSWEDAA